MDDITTNILEDYVSATALSSAANCIISCEAIETHTYRTYIRPREYGKFLWRFWHSNTVDTSWDDGSVYCANLPGGQWHIEAAFLGDGGLIPDGSILPESQVALTFEGRICKNVLPNEKFFSDPVEFDLPENHYLAFTWTITNQSIGKVLPYNCEGILVSAYDAPGDLSKQYSCSGFTKAENVMVLPALLLYKKAVVKKIGFFGDSITQGVRTKMDQYEYWVSKISNGLGTEYGVWNLGSGWARAKDAATDGIWLYKAKQNDEIIICLGVNDIGTLNRSYSEITTDLTSIIGKIKENNPKCTIILCTVPTFDFKEEQEVVWRKLNAAIKANSFEGVSRVFDIAAVLSQPAPEDNLVKAEYHSNFDDPHPNGMAGTAVAKAFLEWY